MGSPNSPESIGTRETNPDEITGQQQSYAGGLGIRHLKALLMFSGITLAYLIRVNMSVAIVAMTDSSTANPDFPGFDWDVSAQTTILSSLHWGYVVTQIPLGQVAHRWSATKLWSLCMLICGIIATLHPIAAETGGWKAVCACRIIMGIAQSAIVPCVHTLLGKWAPLGERARMGAFCYAGSQFGTVVGLPITGVLCASSLGWPSVFYIGGAISIAWSLAFFIWGADSPALHPSIKSTERNYIEESLGQVDAKQKVLPPWKAFFASIPVWSLIVVHCGQTWGYSMLLTRIPTYMNSVLFFDISKNGLISALPYLAMWLLSFPVSWTSDYIQNRGWVTPGVSRKISNSVGQWGPALVLLGLGYVTVEHTMVAVIALISAVGLNAGTICGYQINHIDLSPNFAGTLMSITSSVANVMSILSPLIAGLIVYDTSDIMQWRRIFFITAGIYFLGNLQFIFFGQGKIQPWNKPEVSENAEIGKNVTRTKEETPIINPTDPKNALKM